VYCTARFLLAFRLPNWTWSWANCPVFSYSRPICLSVCPVCDVGVLWPNCQTVGWITMKHGNQVGLGPGHIARWILSSPSQKEQSPQSSAHICCGQMVGWIKMPLGMEVGLGPGDCVRWDPATFPKKGGGAYPQFSAHFYCGQTAGCI